MSGLDLSTAAGALRFCELRRAEMVRCFEQRGRFEANGFSVCAHVFETHAVDMPSNPFDSKGWRTGPKLPSVQARLVELPRVAALFLTAETLGPRFGEMLRRYCALSRAVGVVTMNEMWWGRSSSLEERRARPARIETWDDRREVLYIKLEHCTIGKRAWRATIEREPTTRLTEWRQLDGVLTGYLVNLLDSKETAPS